MKKVFSNKFILYIIITHLLILASNSFLIIQLFRIPKDTFFFLNHNETLYDYNMFLAIITQGQNGLWLFKDPYTTEPTAPSIFYIIYILAGKIFPFPSYITYHILRLISLEAFVLTSYLLCRGLLGKKYGFWAALFSFLGSIAPIPLFGEKHVPETIFRWWFNYDAVKRLNASPPHYFLGFALLISSLHFFFRSLKNLDKRSLILAQVLLTVGGIIQPTILLPVIFASTISMIILRNKKVFLWTLIYLTSSFIPLFINFIQTRADTLSRLFLTWSYARWNLDEPLFNRSLLTLFGIMPLLSLFPAIKSFKLKNHKQIFISLWAFFPFLTILFADLFKIGKIRLISAAPFLPFGILIGLLLKYTEKSKILSIILILFFLLTTLPVSISLFKKDLRDAWNFYPFANYFISRDAYKTMEVMKLVIPNFKSILSEEYMGNVIPAHVPIISYVGHPSITLNYLEKRKNMQQFFSQQKNEKEMIDFLKNNNISYIYYGSDEKIFSSKQFEYPFVKPVFTSGNVNLYKVELPPLIK